ncbi:MAG TPA: PEP-CTERM sorting domain-containing protein [Sedimentisphaerales bacterium]|nr:PEP-CTERM sorting domain-containing protein [Sedimentisphaerales bacterium]
MNKSIGLLSILMMTSVANGTLFISVNGTLDSHIYMNPGEYAAIGVFGDGGTPSNTRLFLFTVGPCSLDAAQAQIFYPGDLSRVEAGLIPDDYERIADAGYSYPGSVVFIELADSSVPPPPLYGVLVDWIDFYACRVANVTIYLTDYQDPTIGYDTLLINIPEPMSIALLALGGLALCLHKRQQAKMSQATHLIH